MRIAVVLSVVLCAAFAHAADVAGSEDHPLITRFPGSEITWYERQNFEPYKIAVGPVTGYRTIDDWVDVQGKITRIHYVLEGDRGFYEAYANYLEAVKAAGFAVLAEGYNKNSSVRGAVGERGFLDVHYRANPTPPGAGLLGQGSSTQGGSGYFAARLDRPEGNVFVVVGVEQHSETVIATHVDIIEVAPVETGLIAVDAAAMSKDIDIYGKVALYGLYFDHDKATLTAESKPALDEIAKLLKERPTLEVYVVGHTDLSGSLEYNLRLSRERAQAVVDALTKDHNIASARLEAHGVGPLVPVASNQGEPGKAKNRRVELVER